MMITQFIKLFRIKHYVKNFLVITPLLCSGKLFASPSYILSILLAVVSFCLISSAIYITNDILDRKKDAKHPKKQHRPIASGAVNVSTAISISIILLIFSIAIAIYLSAVGSWASLTIIVLYYALNIAYSIRLKHVPIIEVAILASGFILRVLYGGFVTGIEVSSWLYLTILSGSFYLGLGKRRNEYETLSDSSTRGVLKRYSQRFLDRNMYMFFALAICFYSLWSMEQGQWALFSVPMVMILGMRYSLIVEGESDGDPVDVILKDKMLLALGGIYAIYMFLAIYAI